METVQAGASNASIEVTSYDQDGDLVIPSAASYKTLGRISGGSWVELRALTAISTLATIMTIDLDSTDTTLIGSGPVEERKVCVYLNTDFWKSFSFEVIDPLCS